MNLSSIINNFKIEIKIQTKNKWMYIFFLILLAMTLWCLKTSYNCAKQAENDVSKTYLQIQEQVREASVNGMIVDKVDMSQSYDAIKGLYQGLQAAATVNNTLLLFALLLPLIMCVIGANIYGSEFSQKTVKIRACHYSWYKSVLTKQIFILISIVTLILFGFIFSYILGNIVETSTKVTNPNIGPITQVKIVSPFWLQIIIATLGGLFYGSLSGCISIISRSSLVGALTGIAVSFIEKIFPFWWLPQKLYSSLLIQNFNYFQGSIVSLPPVINGVPTETNMAIIGILCWCLLVSLITYSTSKMQNV